MGFWPTWNLYNAATKRRISTVKKYFRGHLYWDYFHEVERRDLGYSVQFFFKAERQNPYHNYNATEGNELIYN